MASTPPVVNIAEEAIAIRQLLQRSKSSFISTNILLFTGAFDMRPAQCLFERQGLMVLPFLVDFQARGRFGRALLE